MKVEHEDRTMVNCPYCVLRKGVCVQPHYTTHKTPKGETWIAYCPSCGVSTPHYKGGKPKTLEQAKASWNAFDLRSVVDPGDVPMQTFSPD